MTNIVEFVTFKIKKEASTQNFLLASDKFQIEFLDKQKGYISRKLLANEEKWADLVYWETMDDAQNAIKACDKSAVTDEYMSFLDGNTVEFDHFSVEVDYQIDR